MADGSTLWRVRISAPGATDLRFGFGHYALPAGASLYVIGADDYYQGPYTEDDATASRFNAPVVPGDAATIELHVVADTSWNPAALELTSVGAGFRDAFHREAGGPGNPGAAGACNIDVVCPLGQAYPDPVRAVGFYEFQNDGNGGYYICTGTLLADVPRDRRNYFLTAAHCISDAAEAASMVVYWTYQSAQCGRLVAPPGGFFNDDQHGATLRATRTDVDFTLVELSGTPDPAWQVYHAGWDATGAIPTGTIGISHPSGDVKKITAGPMPSTTFNCIEDGAPTPGTHWWTGPYTQGTTEDGSSGSGLFVAVGSNDGADRRLIGTLSGGDAACSSTTPSQPNDGNDCYGKFAVAWSGASASSRLRDWLDPANTGTTTLSGGDSASPPLPPYGHSSHRIPAILWNQSHQRQTAEP